MARTHRQWALISTSIAQKQLTVCLQIAYAPYAALYVWLKPRGLDYLMQFVVPEKMLQWQKFVATNLENRTKIQEDVQKGLRPERKDFFHYLFGTKDPETGKLGYDLDELFSECEVLTIAGSDTTAIVTAAMSFYLAHNPRIQEKLAKEIVSTFPSASEISGGLKLHNCKYMRAFIHETLRMAPPVPADLAREVRAGGTTVEGHFFPPGTLLSTSPYCLSYNSDIYPEPFTFRPERWLTLGDDPEGSSAEEVALAESGHCAFSAGSRGCVGKNMAWLEMEIVLAKMIHALEIRPDVENMTGAGGPGLSEGRGEVGQYQLYDAFVAMRYGPFVQFRKREHRL
jgi:cytochrome P450